MTRFPNPANGARKRDDPVVDGERARRLRARRSRSRSTPTRGRTAGATVPSTGHVEVAAEGPDSGSAAAAARRRAPVAEIAQHRLQLLLRRLQLARQLRVQVAPADRCRG